jgi:hypothetical protein
MDLKHRNIINGYAVTTACRQGKVEHIYIKSKCGHSILLETNGQMENSFIPKTNRKMIIFMGY